MAERQGIFCVARNTSSASDAVAYCPVLPADNLGFPNSIPITFL